MIEKDAGLLWIIRAFPFYIDSMFLVILIYFDAFKNDLNDP